MVIHQHYHHINVHSSILLGMIELLQNLSIPSDWSHLDFSVSTAYQVHKQWQRKADVPNSHTWAATARDRVGEEIGDAGSVEVEHMLPEANRCPSRLPRPQHRSRRCDPPLCWTVNYRCKSQSIESSIITRSERNAVIKSVFDSQLEWSGSVLYFKNGVVLFCVWQTEQNCSIFCLVEGQNRAE